MGSGKPKIRILRHLARTGGTLISKCLGSMDDVVLISEIHPANLKETDPLGQAVKWFELIGQRQLRSWKLRRGPRFGQFVWACNEGAVAQNKTLVLRDWSHLDYHGKPFVKPTMGTGLRDALEPMFEVIETGTVRHPVDEYLSLLGLGVGKLITREEYLYGCLKFAEWAVEAGFVRYEDFTRDPDAKLRQLCGRLEMGFDPGYSDRWWSYTTITGDTIPAVGRGGQRKEIQVFERRSVDPALIEEFRGNADYQRTCELLGYEV